MSDENIAAQVFAQKERDGAIEQREPKVCIGCGGVATRTNNTLCQDCWNDAEGVNE